MQIAFFETRPRDRRYFSTNLKDHQLSFFNDPLKLSNVDQIKKAEIVSVFIGSEVNAKVLEKLPHLKGVVSRSTGIDHIDINYCEKKKIKVLNVPHYGINTLAEHTFALILTLSRKLYTSISHTKHGGFSTDELIGFDLNNKTLGIIGLGNIGSRVAEIGLAFGMKVIVHTRTKKPIANVKYVELNQLLEQSDVITLHLPLTPKTKHIINHQNINKIKKGALIINTARGGLIETPALVKALEDKQLAGAGLDVLEEEGLMKDEHYSLTYEKVKPAAVKTILLGHILLEMPNVIITPHNAFNSKEALLEISETTLKNIQQLIQA